jgi:hypothetical protein
MAKRKQSAIVSPTEKRAKHAPVPPADDHSLKAPSARGTSPQESVTDGAAAAAASEEAEEPTVEVDIGASYEHKIIYPLTVAIDQLSKEWKSPIYAFYKPIPNVAKVKGRPCHEFMCAARGCKYTSRRYLDTKDKASTGNLIKHAKSCWGDEAWKAANECNNATDARATVTNPIRKSGSITASFKRCGKGKVTYSHRMHTKSETK